HCPQQRCDNQKHAENSENDCAVREEKYFDQYQNHSQNEERDDLPAGEAGEIMAQEKECETNRRDNAGPRHAGNLKFQIRSENSAKQQQWRERSDPKCELLEASWLDLDDVALESGFLGQIGNRIDNAFREQRFAVDLFGGFLGIEGKDCAFWMDDAVADFYFLLFVHECLGEVGIMP